MNGHAETTIALAHHSIARVQSRSAHRSHACWQQPAPGKELRMTQHKPSALRINTRLMQIGLEVIPVFGNDQCGWALDAGDSSRFSSTPVRYRSLDELFFVLTNMNVAGEGTA